MSLAVMVQQAERCDQLPQGRTELVNYWRDPEKVLEWLGEVVYSVQLRGHHRAEVLHHDRLALWQVRKTPMNRILSHGTLGDRLREYYFGPGSTPTSFPKKD